MLLWGLNMTRWEQIYTPDNRVLFQKLMFSPQELDLSERESLSTLGIACLGALQLQKPEDLEQEIFHGGPTLILPFLQAALIDKADERWIAAKSETDLDCQGSLNALGLHVIAGLTLQEIAGIGNLARERIRQKVNQALEGIYLNSSESLQQQFPRESIPPRRRQAEEIQQIRQVHALAPAIVALKQREPLESVKLRFHLTIADINLIASTHPELGLCQITYLTPDERRRELEDMLKETDDLQQIRELYKRVTRRFLETHKVIKVQDGKKTPSLLVPLEYLPQLFPELLLVGLSSNAIRKLAQLLEDHGIPVGVIEMPAPTYKDSSNPHRRSCGRYLYISANLLPKVEKILEDPTILRLLRRKTVIELAFPLQQDIKPSTGEPRIFDLQQTARPDSSWVSLTAFLWQNGYLITVGNPKLQRLLSQGSPVPIYCHRRVDKRVHYIFLRADGPALIKFLQEHL